MITVYVLTEGQSEEAVIKTAIQPILAENHIYLIPFCMNTSKHHKGGAVNFARLSTNIQRLLKQQSDCYISTFLDFYALDTSFPSFSDFQAIPDIYGKIEQLESALHQAVIQQTGCNPTRFIPHIQPHELEALLFSDVEKFANVEPNWGNFVQSLQDVYDKFGSPEYINDSPQTAPSKRLEQMLSPKYKKTTHAPLLAQKIGLYKIENECQHFHQWLEKIRQLAPLN